MAHQGSIALAGGALEKVLGRREAVGPATKSVGKQVEGGGVAAREIENCDFDVGVLGADIEEGLLLLDDEVFQLGRRGCEAGRLKVG